MDYLHHIYAGRCGHFLARREQAPERTILLFGVSRLAWIGNGEGVDGHAPRRRRTLHPGLDSAMTRRRELGGLRLPAGNVVFQEVRVQQWCFMRRQHWLTAAVAPIWDCICRFRKRAFPQHTACRHKPADPVCFCKRCINVKDRPEPLFEAHNSVRDHSRCGSAIRSPVCAHFFR